MSDLDNEELIATRKLHGLDDNLFEEEIEVGEYVRTDKGYESYMANCYKLKRSKWNERKKSKFKNR